MTGRHAVLAGLFILLAAACSSNGEPGGDDQVVSSGWQTLADVPTARTDGTATGAAGLIYVIGGFDQAGVALDVVEIYDPASDSWTAGPPLPIPLNHAMAAGVGDEVFVFGGNAGAGFGDPVDRAFVLRQGEWQELPAMPEARSAGGAGVVDGVIYVVGGVQQVGLADETFVFDTVSETWSTAAGLLTPREHLGAASDGVRVFVAGGRLGGTSTNQAAFEVFDPAAGTWTALPDQPTARGGNAAAVTEAGILVSAGGEEGFDSFDRVEAYEIAAGTWSVLPDLQTPRHGLGVIAIGDTVYVLAGGPRAGLFVSGANEALVVPSSP